VTARPHRDVHLDVTIDRPARPGNVLPLLAKLLHQLEDRGAPAAPEKHAVTAAGSVARGES
jgi:hypothetical protein